MNVRILIQKIRNRGFTIKALGSAISLSPKQLLNEQMINFIRSHKEALLTALHQEQDQQQALHRAYKARLPQGRLEILRIMLKRSFKPSSSNNVPANKKEVEDYLDWLLKQHHYDIENAITEYRYISPKPKIVDGRCKCGYNPPFCTCRDSCAKQSRM